jgi:hypothetical protein
MNQRERILALAVGAMALVMGGYYVIRQIDDGLDRREQTIERLQTEKRQKQRQIMLGKLAEQRLVRYQEQSLPPDAARAKELYTAWLLKSVDEIGFDSPKVNSTTSGLRSPSDAFKAEGFVISGAGSLEQITRLLHKFYSVDYLHRVKTLSITPQQDPRILSFTMTIDALSLPEAPEAAELHGRPSSRLAAGDVQAYIDAIVGRNMFGPPNAPPRMTVASASGQTGRELTITHRQRSRSGQQAHLLLEVGRRYRRPDRPAERPLHLDAAAAGRVLRDAGRPRRRRAFQDDRAAGEDHGDQSAAAAAGAAGVEDKPKYDQVQFTFVNGITEVNGERQVWMIDRRTGKNYWLREGEKFQVGSFDARVAQIQPLEVILEWYNRRAVVRLGENLGEDKERSADQPIDLRPLENAS